MDDEIPLEIRLRRRLFAFLRAEVERLNPDEPNLADKAEMCTALSNIERDLEFTEVWRNARAWQFRTARSKRWRARISRLHSARRAGEIIANSGKSRPPGTAGPRFPRIRDDLAVLGGGEERRRGGGWRG